MLANLVSSAGDADRMDTSPEIVADHLADETKPKILSVRAGHFPAIGDGTSQLFNGCNDIFCFKARLASIPIAIPSTLIAASNAFMLN